MLRDRVVSVLRIGAAAGRAASARRLRDQAQAADRASRRRVDGRAAAQVRSLEAVATAADEDRLARLGLAWQEALADAGKTQSPARSARKASC